MKITYNVQHLPERKRGCRESEEVLAIKAFLADREQKNMLIEYDDAKEAKRRYDSIRNFRSSNKLQPIFDLYRTDKAICIIKFKRAAGVGKMAGKEE